MLLALDLLLVTRSLIIALCSAPADVLAGIPAFAKDGPGLSLVAMREQPLLRLLMLIGKRLAGGYHHPERRLGIGLCIFRPLSLGHQKVAQALGVALAQNGVEPRPEGFIIASSLIHMTIASSPDQSRFSSASQ
jgi:hypothetical protein